MILDILTPEKKVYSGEVSSVRFPGSKGSFEVLQNHAPLISSLKEGKIRIKGTGKGDTREFAISSGFVEVLNNKVTVLVEGVKEAEK